MDTQQTILIVDDNETNLDILCNILNEYDIISSLEAETSIDIANTEDIDIILLDIMMPVMSGYEVCSVLKNNPKTSRIPIIFLTSKHEVEDIQKGFELGAVDYVTKPFNPYELKSRISTHLKLRNYEKNLERKVQKEVEKNRLKDQLMFQQSKQADIGELLIDIAHQWKQPLSEIGSIVVNNQMKLKLENKISNIELENNFDRMSNIVSFMSETTSTFQNFYKPNNKIEVFNISSSINDIMNIIEATFKSLKITIVINKINDKLIKMNKNEYSQILLSILNNMKDIFVLRKIINPEIIINIDYKDKISILTISDNAGGIKTTNIDDIFLAFTSEKNGSGIGLYMSKNIIEKNGGKLKAINIKDGAKFIVLL